MSIRRETGPAVDRRVGADAGRVVDEERRFSDGGLRYVRDVGFPTTRDELVAGAVAAGAPPEVVDALRGLPGGRRFGHPDEVLRLAGGTLMPPHKEER